jgi:hypothetical protein
MLGWGKKQGSAIDGVSGFELSLIITYLPVVSLNEEDASPGFPLFPLVKIVSRSSKCRQNLANTRKENSSIVKYGHSREPTLKMEYSTIRKNSQLLNGRLTRKYLDISSGSVICREASTTK